jgi:hypothetical protein
MLMKKLYGTITILILAAALLAACADILEPPQGNPDERTGTVYITIDGNSAGDRAATRTLLPHEGNFTRYRVSFSGPEPQADIDITEEGKSVNLLPGSWDITITAFNAESPVGRGRKTVEVLYRQTVTADIVISPIIESGRQGGLMCEVTIPTIVDSAILNLTNMTTNTPVPGTPIDLIPISNAGIAAVTAVVTRNLDAGYYLVNVRLELNGGSYAAAGRTEVVHIYDGLVTAAEYIFTEFDFNSTVSLISGVWQDGYVDGYFGESYRFPVAPGASYTVYWNDSQEGDSTKTLDVKVSAYYESTRNSVFNQQDSGYNTPQSFTATLWDTVILRVEPYSFEDTGTGTYAVRYEETAPPLGIGTELADRAWQDGDMRVSGSEFYRFPVAPGVTYAVDWNDDNVNSSGDKTLDVMVSAYYESTGYSIFNKENFSYFGMHRFTALSHDNVILVVEPHYSGDTGTYAVRVVPLTGIGTELTDGEWLDGDMSASGSEFYKFPVVPGASYEVYWMEVSHGSDDKTLDVKVSAYYESTGYSIFNKANESWYYTPQNFTAISRDNVILVVEPYYSGDTGTYAVLYEETASPPSIETELVNGVWQDGDMRVSGPEFYRFPVAPGVTYAVYWNDGNSSGDKTLDGMVSAYYESTGDPILTWRDTPQRFTALSHDNVILVVEPYSSGDTGTYAVRYEETAPGSIWELPYGVWQDWYISSETGPELYRFPVVDGTHYVVHWNDRFEGDSTKTLNVRVSAYYESTGTPIFTRQLRGYYTPQSFTALSHDNVILRVEPYSSGDAGTYAVRYYSY